MKIEVEQVYTGNINICTQYDRHNAFENKLIMDQQEISSDHFGYIIRDGKLYKENATLIKIKHGGYIDIDEFKSILDYFDIKRNMEEKGFTLGGIMMPTSAYGVDTLYVDKDSLKPYYDKTEKINNKHVFKLTRDLRKKRK